MKKIRCRADLYLAIAFAGVFVLLGALALVEFTLL